MYEVRSAKGLTEDLLKLTPPAAAAEKATAVAPVAPAERETGGPIAIVGVHGISPIQQYAFQDQLATGMLSYLNAQEAVHETGRTWSTMVYWPRVKSREGDPALKPSALRIYRDDEPDPEIPRSRVYDVYEGYWSPYSKNKTNVVSALKWLLNITFLATSSTASIPASWRKLFWDVGYVLTGLIIAVLCLAGAFVAGVFAWNEFITVFGSAGSAPPAFWTFVVNPLGQIGAVTWAGWVQLAFDVLIAYLLVQLVVVWRTRASEARRTRELRYDAREHGHFDNETIAARTFHRIATIAFVVFVLALMAADAIVLLDAYSPDAATAIVWHSVLLVISVGLLQIARGIGDFMVEDLLGDVQIYCTHDSNSAFYAIRQQIIGAVTKALLGALNAVDTTRTDAAGNAPPLYEKIHLAGHSLGTTVGLDVLIRVRQLAFEDPLLESAWPRIRSFTTFGTALEKTRFFFDVRNPTISAAQQQWENDVYGKYFTLHPETLHQPDNRDGIFWSNHWYFHDIVANRIVSYESDVAPGQSFHVWKGAHNAHAICEDNEIPHARPPWAFVHGDYLGDPLFWNEVGPVFTT